MVTRGESGTGGIVVAGFGGEIVVWGDGDNLADTLVRLIEPHANEVGAICSGGGTRSCAGNGLGRVSGIFEVEEGIGEMGESVRDTRSSSFDDINMMAAVRGDSRANIESTRRVVVPSKAFEGGIMYVAKLASWEEGVCREVVREMVEAVISGACWVWVPRLQVVEGDFHKGK